MFLLVFKRVNFWGAAWFWARVFSFLLLVFFYLFVHMIPDVVHSQGFNFERLFGRVLSALRFLSSSAGIFAWAYGPPMTMRVFQSKSWLVFYSRCDSVNGINFGTTFSSLSSMFCFSVGIDRLRYIILYRRPS